MLDCTISFSLWWTMVKMAIYTQKCEQKWLKINNRGVGIKMSWVEKNRKINNRRGTIIRDFRVLGKLTDKLKNFFSIHLIQMLSMLNNFILFLSHIKLLYKKIGFSKCYGLWIWNWKLIHTIYDSQFVHSV